MDQQQAINVLINVANLAQSKGILNLNDAVVVSQAIGALAPQQDEPLMGQPLPGPYLENQGETKTQEEIKQIRPEPAKTRGERRKEKKNGNRKY